MISLCAIVAQAEMKPVQEGVFDFHASELALFALGGLATLAALAVGVWLFIRASREERAREDRERAADTRRTDAGGPQ